MAEVPEEVTPPPGAEKKPESEETAASEQVPEKSYTQAEMDEIVAKVKTQEHRKRENLKRKLGEPQQQARTEKTPDEPKRESYPDYESYIEARAEWKAVAAVDRQIAKDREERAAASQKADGERVQKEFTDRLAKARDKYPEVDEAIEALGSRVSSAVGHAIKESDVGPELIVYLHKNPDEFDDLANLTPTAAIRAIGRLEAKLAASKPEPPKSPSRPINPVNNRSTPSNELRDDLPEDEWQKRRWAQIAEKQRAKSV